MAADQALPLDQVILGLGVGHQEAAELVFLGLASGVDDALLDARDSAGAEGAHQGVGLHSDQVVAVVSGQRKARVFDGLHDRHRGLFGALLVGGLVGGDPLRLLQDQHLGGLQQYLGLIHRGNRRDPLQLNGTVLPLLDVGDHGVWTGQQGGLERALGLPLVVVQLARPAAVFISSGS